MSVNQSLYALADTNLATPGAGTVNSVGITPANRPLDELSVEIEISGLAMTLDADFVVQTAPAGVAAGGAWKNCASSVARFIDTGTRVQIRVVDPILDQVRVQVISRGNGTWTNLIRWLSSRNLLTVET